MDMSVRATVEEAVQIIKSGGMIILTDDEARENEGDLVFAAEFVTPEKINFMATYGRGLICVSLSEKRCDELMLKPMSENNSCRFGTAFTVSVEARQGVTTGISAYDRAKTISVLADPLSKSTDLIRPGPIFPLRARNGGVLVRPGQTEGSIDLARLAGLNQAGVICEIMNDDGTMARMDDLEKFAKIHSLKILTIADLIEYRKLNDNLIEKVSQAILPTEYGTFKMEGYQNKADGKEAVAIIKGDVNGGNPPLVRVHSQCLTGDGFASLRCDCGNQLHTAMQMIESEGRGVILYMFQEGRGIGLLNKIKAYKLQDEGYDTVEANIKLGFLDDERDYSFGAALLRKLGITKIRLLSNNPRKFTGLSEYGLEITERVPIQCGIGGENLKYMQTKKDKLGHILDI